MTDPKRTSLGGLWNSIQAFLFPILEDEIGGLDAKHLQFVAICALCAPQDYMGVYRWMGTGRPPQDRLALCKAFIAKALWDFPSTRVLIDAIRHRPTLRRLCGWKSLGEVPSEAAFSRAFAHDGLPQRIHEAMIKTHYGDKVAGHLSRDATAIHAREKAAAKAKNGSKPPYKRGRKPKTPAPSPEPSRLECQLERRLEDNLADLPVDCGWGCKKNNQGKGEYWRGYGSHVDGIDTDIPVSAILSSASLHDHQAAIPLAQMSAGRYRQRNAAERVKSHLHDEHGGRHVPGARFSRSGRPPNLRAADRARVSCARNRHFAWKHHRAGLGSGSPKLSKGIFTPQPPKRMFQSAFRKGFCKNLNVDNVGLLWTSNQEKGA